MTLRPPKPRRWSAACWRPPRRWDPLRLWAHGDPLERQGQANASGMTKDSHKKYLIPSHRGADTNQAPTRKHSHGSPQLRFVRLGDTKESKVKSAVARRPHAPGWTAARGGEEKWNST